MKRKLFILSLLASILQSFNPSILAAQEATDLKLLSNPKDSTFRFCEITTKDGDTVGIRFFPQAWTKASGFKDFAYRMALAETERKQEFERLTKAVTKNIAFFAAAVDSIGGAGSYAGMQHEGLKQKLQGAWSLVIRSPDPKEEAEVITCVINGDNLQSKDKASVIEWTNGESFKLKSGGLFAFNLTFKLVEADRYVAERSGVKYVLKR